MSSRAPRPPPGCASCRGRRAPSLYRSPRGRAPADKVFESQGIKIFLDPKSALFVSGTEIDWQESMMGAGFAFKNPLAKGSCGCGTSFTA
jgi:iron-sulfur cluster assembly accessory protein